MFEVKVAQYSQKNYNDEEYLFPYSGEDKKPSAMTSGHPILNKRGPSTQQKKHELTGMSIKSCNATRDTVAVKYAHTSVIIIVLQAKNTSSQCMLGLDSYADISVISDSCLTVNDHSCPELESLDYC